MDKDAVRVNCEPAQIHCEFLCLCAAIGIKQDINLYKLVLNDVMIQTEGRGMADGQSAVCFNKLYKQRRYQVQWGTRRISPLRRYELDEGMSSLFEVLRSDIVLFVI